HASQRRAARGPVDGRVHRRGARSPRRVHPLAPRRLLERRDRARRRGPAGAGDARGPLRPLRARDRHARGLRFGCNLASMITVDDSEAEGRARLPQAAYDYYRSGADEEHTLRRNRDAFAQWEIAYRVFVDVSAPRVATTVLGAKVETPILVAPTAYHKLAH